MTAPPAAEPNLASRRERLAAASTLALVFGVFIWIACGMTIVQMGGEAERGADGSFILNNHGQIVAAGRMGWALARILKWTAFVGAGGCVLGALVLALWLSGTPGARKGDFARGRRTVAWVFVLALAVLLAWGAVLVRTPLARWLAALD
jgi:hypothetical protein